MFSATGLVRSDPRPLTFYSGHGMGFIYSIKNKVNGHEYIGQTRYKKVETRWNQHKRDPSGLLERAFNAHGIDAFDFTIVCEIPVEELNDREILEIKERNTLAPNGYNLQTGGKSYGCHPDTRKKLSEQKKGNTYNFGKKTPPSIIAKMKEAHSGPNHHMYGKHLPEWVKDILRKSQPTAKKVDQYTKDGEFVKTWDSIRCAATTLGILSSHISECCKGQLKTYKSFIWRHNGVGINDVKKRKSIRVYNPVTRRAYFARNRERYATLKRKYYMNRTLEQKERDRERRRLWARAHPRILTYSQKLKLREYYRKNSDILKKKQKERYAKLTTEEKKELHKKKKYTYKPLNEAQKQRAREYTKKNIDKIRAQARERRRNRTPEQKARDSEKMKEWRRNNPQPYRPLTTEQRKRYRESRKEAFALYEAKRKEKRQNRTPEQIEQDNQARKEKSTPEKDEARRQRRKEWEANMPPEQKEEMNRRRREDVTEEQKEKRRAQGRERWANRTPEQIAKEQERGRRRYEELKNKKLQNNKDDGSLQGDSSRDSLSGLAVDQNS